MVRSRPAIGEVEGRPREGDAVFRLAAQEADVGLVHWSAPVSGGFATRSLHVGQNAGMTDPFR